MNVASLYQQYLDWQEKRQGPFPGGEVLFDRATIVIVPSENPDQIIKITEHDKRTDVPTAQQEFAILERMRRKSISGDRFILPDPIAWGSHPAHLVMTHMGEAYVNGLGSVTLSEQVGRAAGEFAAMLYEKDDTMHTDLYGNNFTAFRNGKIGIIDLASVEPAQILEHMFRVPLAQRDAFVGFMAAEFKERTGHDIDPDRVRQLCLPEAWPRLRAWQDRNPEYAAAAVKRLDANLLEWKNLRESAKKRPTPKFAKLKNLAPPKVS